MKFEFECVDEIPPKGEHKYVNTLNEFIQSGNKYAVLKGIDKQHLGKIYQKISFRAKTGKYPVKICQRNCKLYLENIGVNADINTDHSADNNIVKRKQNKTEKKHAGSSKLRRKEIIKLWNTGTWSVEDLADYFEMSVGGIEYNVFPENRKHQATYRNRQKTLKMQDNHAKMRKMRKDGVSVTKTAKECGVSISTVCYNTNNTTKRASRRWYRKNRKK